MLEGKFDLAHFDLKNASKHQECSALVWGFMLGFICRKERQKHLRDYS